MTIDFEFIEKQEHPLIMHQVFAAQLALHKQLHEDLYNTLFKEDFSLPEDIPVETSKELMMLANAALSLCVAGDRIWQQYVATGKVPKEAAQKFMETCQRLARD